MIYKFEKRIEQYGGYDAIEFQDLANVDAAFRWACHIMATELNVSRVYAYSPIIENEKYNWEYELSLHV